ncbi:MAG: hypothetical protein AB7I18_06335 [Candidatus Berkiella sp.]
MTQAGPIVDIQEVQQAVQQYFYTIVNQQPGEVGTCKKIVNFGCLHPDWADLCVVFGKNTGVFLHEMVLKEHQLLTHLQAQGYPIVKVFGEAFNVQPNQERFGMIESHIPGVFIEAKTPAPTNLLLTAALLGIPCKAQEGWLAFNRKNVMDKIALKLSNPQIFANFQQKAQTLALAFENLITQQEANHEKIHDLQMIIRDDGSLTVIDPLEVITVSPEGSMHSLLEGEALNQADLHLFSQKTRQWLEQAKQFCNRAATTTNNASILGECASFGQGPLIFTSKADPHGRSPLNRLKARGTAQDTDPSVQGTMKNSPN